jgi:hypothetical protein
MSRKDSYLDGMLRHLGAAYYDSLHGRAYKVMEGNAAQVLVTESAGADLLVVGSRGHGGFVEALLGSVGQHCAHHAACPVVVIRGAQADA